LSTRPEEEVESEEQRKARDALKDVVITERMRRMSSAAATASIAATAPTPITPKLARVEEGAELELPQSLKKSRQVSLNNLPELPPSPSLEQNAEDLMHTSASSSSSSSDVAIAEQQRSRFPPNADAPVGEQLKDESSLPLQPHFSISIPISPSKNITTLSSASMHAATIFEPTEDVTLEDLDEYAFAPEASEISREMQGEESLPKWHAEENSVAQQLRKAMGTELPVIQLIPRAVVQPPPEEEKEVLLRFTPEGDAISPLSTSASSSTRPQVRHSSYARHHNRASSNAHVITRGANFLILQSIAGASPRAEERKKKREAAEEARTSPVISHITVAPAQEGFSLKDQSLVAIPRAILRFFLLEPLLERLFPQIRVLSENAIDSAIFLKFSQLLILLVAFMTVCCLSLVPIHVAQNTIDGASSFSAASIASVPSGSRWFLAHFLVAYACGCAFVAWMKLLRRHAKRAVALSAAVSDDTDYVASVRTVHITHLPLNFTEERLGHEIEKLLPSKKHAADGSILTDPSRSVLSIYLYHSVPRLSKLMRKRAAVLVEIERLSILAFAVASNPSGKLRKEWMDLLQGKREDNQDSTNSAASAWAQVLRRAHPPGVKKQLETLTTKRLKLTGEIVEEVMEQHERAPKEEETDDSGTQSASFSQKPSPSLGPSTQSMSSRHLSHQVSSSLRSLSSSGSSSRFSGQAFVAFRSAVAAVDAVERARGDADSAWKVQHASKSKEILYENLHEQGTLAVGCTRWFLANSSLLALLFFVGIPTLILRSITDFTTAETTSLQLDANGVDTWKLLSNYLSTVIMWLTNWRGMPFMLKKALELEKHPTRSAYESSRFWKSSLFLFAIMILLPVTALTTVGDSLNKGGKRIGSRWYQLLSSAFFINSGIYFAQFITHEIFVNLAINGFSLMVYLKRVWRLRNALTAKEFSSAMFTVEPIVLQYDRLCAAFGLLLLNAVSVPLLLPFGLIYFIVQYCIDSSRLRSFPIAPMQNKGVIPTYAIKCILLYIAGWALLMGALFFSQHSSTYYAFGVFFILLSLLVVTAYAGWWKLETEVPEEVRRNAAQMVDEKIQMYREIVREPSERASVEEKEESKEAIEEEQQDDACGASKKQPSVYLHLHTHRAPCLSSLSPSFHSRSSLPLSLCPDCLYRSPVWREIEEDEEIMEHLRARVEIRKLHVQKVQMMRQRTVEDGFTLMTHAGEVEVEVEAGEAGEREEESKNDPTRTESPMSASQSTQ
jgi:hypothetical protein